MKTVVFRQVFFRRAVFFRLNPAARSRRAIRPGRTGILGQM